MAARTIEVSYPHGNLTEVNEESVTLVERSVLSMQVNTLWKHMEGQVISV